MRSEKSLMHDPYTKGKAEGDEVGMAKGEKIDEAKKNHSITEKMLIKGSVIDFISDVTELSEAEIKLLVEEEKKGKPFPEFLSRNTNGRSSSCY